MTNQFQNSLNKLTLLLQSRANRDNAVHMSVYMKTRFSFFGIKTPERRKLTREWWKKFPISSESELLNLANELWNLEQREFHYVGSDTLKKYKSMLTPSALNTLKRLIINNSWWDTVDTLAAHPIGQIILNFPETGQIMDTWIEDDNMWVRRTAILHQLQFKIKTNENRLFYYCEKCMDEKEFFIRKAIGWALRQYSYTNMKSVFDFVHAHEDKLSHLSKREAMKGYNRINKN